MTWLQLSIGSVLIVFDTLLAVTALVLAVRASTSSAQRRITSLSLRIESVEATCTAMHSVIEALNQRDKMRKVRAAQTSSDGSSDSKSQEPPKGTPEWKNYMRLQLHTGKLKAQP